MSGPDAPPADSPRKPATPLVVLGIAVLVFGGVVLSHSFLGLPFLVAGAWLTTGRDLHDLRRTFTYRRGELISWVLSLGFFAGAILQAGVALLPVLPLFAISTVLLPPVRDALFALTRCAPPPLLREFLIVALLCTYGYLVAYDLAERAETKRQSLPSISRD